MLIIIEGPSTKSIYEAIDVLHRKCGSKITHSRKRPPEVDLANGDKIKFTLDKYKCIATLGADVAIGPHSNELTLTSKQRERNWSFCDLDNYLEKL